MLSKKSLLAASSQPVSRLASFADEAARVLFAKEQFAFLLQLAYSGELAATRAYLGHRHSLKSRLERAEIGKIIRDEIRHRQCLSDMLAEVRSAPDPGRERKMERVGRAISLFCHVGGWFFAMYGAGRLEAQNIREYELGARLAHLAELHRFIDPLLGMAEVEWDHERYFRSKAMSHWLWRIVPNWAEPPPRERIRVAFREFESKAERPVLRVRAPRLVR
jgi:rubrerythrin